MVNFNGAFEYIILKQNNIYVIFFLDNHNATEYCPISSDNIDSLFSLFHQNDSKTTFIFEELLDNSKFITLFPQSEHLNKYLQFYNNNMNNPNYNIIPVDIRILFDNLDLDDYFINLNYLFDFTDYNNNPIINKIKTHIYHSCILSSNFLQYYNNLKTHFINIKNTINNNPKLIELINKNDSNNLDYLNLDYPWTNNDINNNQNLINAWEMLFSSLLELYSISCIIQSNSKYIILYLGACHCITIFNILEKYFNYRNVKPFGKYDLTKMQYFYLEQFKDYNTSCINYTNIIIK